MSREGCRLHEGPTGRVLRQCQLPDSKRQSTDLVSDLFEYEATQSSRKVSNIPKKRDDLSLDCNTDDESAPLYSTIC